MNFLKAKHFLIFFICSILFDCADNTLKSKDEKPPNIIYILADDLGVKDLGQTGSNYYSTPNIDRLASGSLIFTQAYSNSRVCSPSRASILTGRFTARHGITDWIGAKTGENWRTLNRYDQMLPANYVHALPKADTTLAEALKTQGYQTFFAGKWHLGGEGSLPENHGFDINVGGLDKGTPPGGYFSPFKNEKLADKRPGENLSLRLADETISFIKNNKSKPFFAFLSFYAVHGPIQTTQEKWKKYRDKAAQMGITDTVFAMDKNLPIRHKQDNPVYAGLVETLDEAVGKVITALQEEGLDKNTIIILTSDNGGVTSGDSYSTSNLPYKGGKGYQWEGGIRVPLYMHIPNSDLKTNEINYPVTLADLYPTLLDYAHLKLLPNQHLDGMSLKNLIDTRNRYPERPLFWHYPHYGNQGGDPSSIIRKGDWKLIYLYENQQKLLFNLSSDPYEEKDVAQKFPKKTQELFDNLQEWLKSVNAKYPIPDPTFDPEKRKEYEKRIRALLIKQEKIRKKMLKKDYQPNADWWGSETI